MFPHINKSMLKILLVWCLVIYMLLLKFNHSYYIHRKWPCLRSLTKISQLPPLFEEKHPVNEENQQLRRTDNHRAEWSGFVLLNVVAVLWGSQHIVIKSSISNSLYSSASLLNFWRFMSSSLLFSTVLIQRKIDRKVVQAGCELGIYTFLGFGLQSIGLETTTASRSAFLLYLNVKFVPFLAALIYQRSISYVTWISALLALAGTALLSTDGGWPNIGDSWCVGAALASAFYILRLETHAKLNDAAGLNAVAFLTVTALCGLWVGGDYISGKLVQNVVSENILTQLLVAVWTNPLPVLYLGVVTTGLCNYLQTLGQRSIPAERAAIIYSMDPVYAAFFAYAFLGESLGAKGICGAALIIAGIVVSNKYANKRDE